MRARRSKITVLQNYVTNDLLEPPQAQLCRTCGGREDSQTGNRVQWNFHDCLPQQAKLLPNRQRSECPLSVCPPLLFVCACELFIEHSVPFRRHFPLVRADFCLPRPRTSLCRLLPYSTQFSRQQRDDRLVKSRPLLFSVSPPKFSLLPFAYFVSFVLPQSLPEFSRLSVCF